MKLLCALNIIKKCQTKNITNMNKEVFLKLDGNLKDEINKGIHLNKDDQFGNTLGFISVYACQLLSQKKAAYQDHVESALEKERQEYFANIEAILSALYNGFSNGTFDQKIKSYYSTLLSPKSGKEKFEAMQEINKHVSKLSTSWVSKSSMEY